MKIHLFGLPISAHIRLKVESGGWGQAVPPPHEFRSTPILSNELGKITDAEVQILVDSVADGFTHLVLVGVRDWAKLQPRLGFDSRMHVARVQEPIRHLTWPFLQQLLCAIVGLDELWLTRIAPTDLRHPLLLPPTFFATDRETKEYWHKCDVYSENQLVGAEQLLTAVERCHRRPDSQGGRSWLDSQGRRYRIDHSRHGRSETDRAGIKSYRFCFEIPQGFHFDVTDNSGRYFTVNIDNNRQRLLHCNVNPWGKVW